MRPGFSCIDQGLQIGPGPSERAIYEVRATGVKLSTLNCPGETAFNGGYGASRIGFGYRRRLRESAVLLKRINVIWVVQSSIKKYSRSLLTQITCISFAIPAHTERRFAIVTNVGQGCGGRGRRQGRGR
jgi:hypothetical protein